MDIICPRCSEPLDIYELHNMYKGNRKLSFDEAKSIFYKNGCGILLNEKQCELNETEASQASAILNDLLGDDIDGVATMLEDFGYA